MKFVQHSGSSAPVGVRYREVGFVNSLLPPYSAKIRAFRRFVRTGGDINGNKRWKNRRRKCSATRGNKGSCDRENMQLAD